MDTLLHTSVLDVLPTTENPSLNLTTKVNNLLNGTVSEQVTRDDVLGFCKVLLLGDDKSPTPLHKSLHYIAKSITSDPPGYRVVVTVVKVSHNLQEILLNRVQMFKQLISINDPSVMISVCTKMIMSDPRNHNPGGIEKLLEKTETTGFTYKRKCSQGAGVEHKDQSAKRSRGADDNIDMDNVLKEAVEALMDIKTSPVRISQHSIPENVPTGSSVMSEAGEVETMTPHGHRRSARTLNCFFDLGD